MLFVNGANDDATTCIFSRGCCEINETAVSRLWRTANLTKYDFLNIHLVTTNIPLRFNFYLYYFNCWFERSDSEKQWKKQIGLRACPKHNCAI